VTVLKEAWDTLRSVATIVDKVTALAEEVTALRAENRDLRDRLIRIETIIDEARRQAQPRRLPPKKP
jgi:regulator of replication initiation timing